jgi:TrmH family RNA methyltransferase
MEADLVIRSRQNALLKRARAVGAGKESGSILLEGERLIRDALGSGVELEVVLVAEDRMDIAGGLAADGVAVRLVASDLLDQVSSLDAPPGSIALGAVPSLGGLAGWESGVADLVLVIGAVSNPGNMGALLRSAEAAGASAVVCIDGGARPYSPKVLRGSMGSALRMRIFGGGPEAVHRALDGHGFTQVRAVSRGGTDAGEMDCSGRFAIWIGGETADLPACVSDLDPITIRTVGAVESLNVAVAGALLLFAAGRNQAEADG